MTAAITNPFAKAFSSQDRTLAMVLALSMVAFLVVALLLPIGGILIKSFQDSTGNWVYLRNIIEYLSQENSLYLIQNSLFVSVTTTLIVIPLAFTYAYAITRTVIPLKGVFRYLALVPLLAPSLLPAISFVYIFGNQGFLREFFGIESIYGAWGIILGEIFYVFPHALMILVTALSISDARLYEAADTMGASKKEKFFLITLPGAKYGLISATMVTFTLVITDFGVPKVIGGDYYVLATEIYKQVIGQQNFEMGATVGLILLLPTLISFVVDGYVQKRQKAMMGAKSVVYQPKKNPSSDIPLLIFITLFSAFLLFVLGVAIYASLVKFWPYNLELGLQNYNFDIMDGGGWESYYNSLKMAIYTAFFGVILVFLSAYAIEKGKIPGQIKGIIKFLALTPMAVPGLVLGLGYIFFFNLPENPLNFMYATMSILVLCTVAHFFTPSYLTAVTALKQIDKEFENVGESMKVPFYVTFWRVTVPISAPAILEIARYYFVNAMTTISAVIFIYSPDTTLAAVAVMNMDDAGDIGPAAAMGTMIVLTSFAATILFAIFSKIILGITQQWRRK